MGIRLDHTIVPAKDKTDRRAWLLRPGVGHYAFHVGEAEFDAIFERVKARGHADGCINTRRGGRGFYFEDP